MSGSRLMAKLLLFITSITLISLMALTRCGLIAENEQFLQDNGTCASWKNNLLTEFSSGILWSNECFSDRTLKRFLSHALLFMDSLADSRKTPAVYHSQPLISPAFGSDGTDKRDGYLEQREEESRQEVDKLRAEIRSLKLQILDLKSKWSIPWAKNTPFTPS